MAWAFGGVLAIRRRQGNNPHCGNHPENTGPTDGGGRGFFDRLLDRVGMAGFLSGLTAVLCAALILFHVSTETIPNTTVYAVITGLENRTVYLGRYIDECHVTFKTADGEFSLKAPHESQCQTLRVGDSGNLTWHGKVVRNEPVRYWVSFVRE